MSADGFAMFQIRGMAPHGGEIGGFDGIFVSEKSKSFTRCALVWARRDPRTARRCSQSHELFPNLIIGRHRGAKGAKHNNTPLSSPNRGQKIKKK